MHLNRKRILLSTPEPSMSTYKANQISPYPRKGTRLNHLIKLTIKVWFFFHKLFSVIFNQCLLSQHSRLTWKIILFIIFFFVVNIFVILIIIIVFLVGFILSILLLNFLIQTITFIPNFCTLFQLYTWSYSDLKHKI